MIRDAFICLALLAPGAALAEPLDYGSVDGYAVPDAHVRAVAPGVDVTETGKGAGIRVMSRATDTLVVLAEAEQLEVDNAMLEFARYRIGAGLALPSTTGAYLTYDRLELGYDEADALGVHFRLAGYVAAPLLLYAQAGYLGADADSFYHDGFELGAGAAWDFAQPWGLFADYRALLLDDRQGPDRLHAREVRVGVRFRFDC